MKRRPPPSLVAYELEPGTVMFVHELAPIPVIDGLTRAEQEVLTLLLRGHDTNAIAESRQTAARTIANQTASIYRKLGVGSRAELAAKVLGADRAPAISDDDRAEDGEVTRGGGGAARGRARRRRR